jgi:hypothetical protein
MYGALRVTRALQQYCLCLLPPACLLLQVDREEREWCAGLPTHVFAPWVERLVAQDVTRISAPPLPVRWGHYTSQLLSIAYAAELTVYVQLCMACMQACGRVCWPAASRQLLPRGGICAAWCSCGHPRLLCVSAESCMQSCMHLTGHAS